MISLDLLFLILPRLNRPFHHRLSLINRSWILIVRHYYLHWARQLQDHWVLKQFSLKERSEYLREARVVRREEVLPITDVPIRLFSSHNGEPVYLTLNDQLYLNGEYYTLPVKHLTYSRRTEQLIYLLIDRFDQGYLLTPEDGLVPLYLKLDRIDQMALLTKEGYLCFCLTDYFGLENLEPSGESKSRFCLMALTRWREEIIFLTVISEDHRIHLFLIDNGTVLFSMERPSHREVLDVIGGENSSFLYLLTQDILEVSYCYYVEAEGFSQLKSDTIQCQLLCPRRLKGFWGRGERVDTYYLIDKDDDLWELDLSSFDLNETNLTCQHCPRPEGYRIDY